jgi:hypothetical protein
VGPASRNAGGTADTRHLTHNGPGLPTWPAYVAGTDPYLGFDTPISQAAGYHAPQCAILDQVEVYGYCGSLCHYFVLGQWWHKFKHLE